HEEVLLVGRPVVHPDRLARPEHEESDTYLREVDPTLEGQRLSASLPVAPASLAGVQDEPALSAGHQSELSPLQRRFGHRHSVTTYSNEAQASSVKIAS